MTLAVALLMLIATVALAVVAYVPVRDSVYAERLSWMAQHARAAMRGLDGDVHNAMADVASLAAAPSTLELLRARAAGDAPQARQWEEALAGLFAATLRAKPEYVQLRLIGPDADGTEVVRVDRNMAGGAVQIVPRKELQAKGDRPYYIDAAALPAGSIYVSPIELNQERGAIQTPHMPVLRLATPLHGGDGRLAGVLVANIDMRPTFSRLHASVPPNIDTYVLNDHGDFLMHPDPKREFGFELGEPYRLQDEFPALARLLKGQDGEGDDFVLEMPGSGVLADSLAAAAATENIGGTRQVAVLLLAAQGAILSEANEVLLLTALTGLGVILLAAAVAFAMARALTRPLIQVTEAVRHFDRGEPVHLPQQAPREINTLVTAFRRHIARERLFDAAVRTSTDAILTKDLDGVITAWNGAAEALYGYPAEEAVGQPVRMLVPPERIDEFEAIQKQIATGRPTGVIETVRLTRGGRRLNVSVSVSPVHALDGELIGASEISRDLTAQKRADAMFRLALEASPAAILMVDEQGKILLANREAAETFGFGFDELMGLPVELLLPDRFRPEHPYLRQEFNTYPSKRMMGQGRDLFGRRKDGTKFPVEVGLNPLQTPDGPCILIVILDITERKRNAAELERKTVELERSNAELQQFAYVASHDLQEPLRMVYSFCELLKDNFGDTMEGEAIEFIDFAIDGAHRMRQMIDDLLDYSRVQSRPAEISAVSADEALDDALFVLSDAIQKSGAEIVRDELPMVAGNQSQLSRVFQNLIANSLKFHSAIPPRIEIAVERQGDDWCFSVRDNGVGFDPRHAENIFRVFQRLHTRTEYPGTGIGLAICQRIVEHHGGRIWAESDPGKGAVFHFVLKSIAGDDRNTPQTGTASRTPPGSAKERRE